MDTDDRHDALTERIIGCAFKVANRLGPGFLERVYENALVHELRKCGLLVDQQRAFPVVYDEVVVGEYVADIVVENKVLLELKAVKALDDVFTAICINYLKASGLRRCLLINFAKPRIDIRRIAL